MNKVLPGLFLGNYRDSKDMGQLERHKISHIVAIHDAARRLYPEKEYLCIMASDSPYQNLSQYFSACNDFIHNARVQGGNVLIHCLAGMSRSVTIVVAYIMSITSFQLNEAQKVVRGARPISNPNSGFCKQLQEFESSQRLFDERRRMLEKFPGSTFLESDVEACKKLLVSYNNLLLSRAICEGRCHSERVCPTATCRTRYPLPSSTSRLRDLKSTSTPPPDSVDSASTPPSSPKAGYKRNEKPLISPLKSGWERHYGCWRDHLKCRQGLPSGLPSPQSAPNSPAHWRRGALRGGRSDSVTSIASTASLVSLPATLQDTSITYSPKTHHSSLEKFSPSSPISPQRRKLPQTGSMRRRELNSTPDSPSKYSLKTTKNTSVVGAKMYTEEEEDETLAVVFDPPEVKAHGSFSGSRPSSSITRWVMKRSALNRFSMDNN